MKWVKIKSRNLIISRRPLENRRPTKKPSASKKFWKRKNLPIILWASLHQSTRMFRSWWRWSHLQMSDALSTKDPRPSLTWRSERTRYREVEDDFFFGSYVKSVATVCFPDLMLETMIGQPPIRPQLKQGRYWNEVEEERDVPQRKTSDKSTQMTVVPRREEGK